MLHNDIIIKENLRALHIAVTQLYSLSKANENTNSPKQKLKFEIALTNNLQTIRDILNGDQIFTKNLSYRLQLLATVVRDLNKGGGL